MTMKTYFITGGEGFIGYHISKKLLEDENNTVVTYDAQKHYIPFDKSNWAKYQEYRIKSLSSKRMVRERGDCSDRGWLKTSLEKYKPDVIIHLAALPIASISNEYPTEAKVNIFDSIVTLLDIMKGVTFNYSRTVYTSSSMVYGNFNRDENGEILPATEKDKCNPIGIYGAMKLAGEHIVQAYNYRFEMPTVIIRPSAVYGPTDSNRRVTEIFLNNAMEGRELELDNGGRHQLDFSYVEDVVSGFLLAAEKKDAIGETFNITRGEGRSIRELAEIIKTLIPETQITERNLKPYRPNRGALNISKAREMLGYDPKYPLEKGLKQYYTFMKTQLG